MKILAVLCATEKRGGYDTAVASLEKNGIDVYTYGLGMDWQGNGMKQVAAWKAANENLGKYDFILSLDGFDTFCVASSEEMVNSFISFRHPMVISAEQNCWPIAQKANLYPVPRTNSRFRFICAGAYMARTDYVAKMLGEWGVGENFRADSDQRFLTGVLLSNPGCMMIDEECLLFQSLCGVKPEDFFVSGKRFINKYTYRMPCVFHGNGHTDMSWYIDQAK